MRLITWGGAYHMGEAYHMVYQRLITLGGAYQGVGLIEGWGL